MAQFFGLATLNAGNFESGNAADGDVLTADGAGGAAWVGTAAMLAVRAQVYTHCKRAAKRAEKLLSTGAGTTATPATMGFEGSRTYQDVEAALALP